MWGLQPSPGTWLVLAGPSGITELPWDADHGTTQSPKLILQSSSSPALHSPTSPLPSQGHTETPMGGRRAQGPLGNGLSEGLLVRSDWTDGPGKGMGDGNNGNLSGEVLSSWEQ